MNTYSENLDVSSPVGTVSAFVIGAMVGAAAALIFAPSDGRQARAYLRRRGQELGREAVEVGRQTWLTQSERVKSAVAGRVEQASEVVGHVFDEGKAAYTEAKAARQGW